MRKQIWDYVSLALLAGLIITLDQWTKAIVRTQLQLSESWTPWEWLVPFARIVHWKNTGAAFGMLPGFSDVFTILAIVVSAAILYYYPQVPKKELPLRLAMALQLGGALGNLIDRVHIGWVTDFISIGNFPVFNIADASISAGVAILVVWLWHKEQKKEPLTSASGEEPQTDKSSESLPKETLGE